MSTEMYLRLRYQAQCGHRLIAGVPDGHPCARSHGHRYVFWITVVGRVDPETGMVVEYDEINNVVKADVLHWIDHHDLNTLPARLAKAFGVNAPIPRAVELDQAGGWNPTVENLAKFMAAQLLESLPGNVDLTEIEIEEDENATAILRLST